MFRSGLLQSYAKTSERGVRTTGFCFGGQSGNPEESLPKPNYKTQLPEQAMWPPDVTITVDLLVILPPP